MYNICNNQKLRFYFIILSSNYYKKTFTFLNWHLFFSEFFNFKYIPFITLYLYFL